MTGASVGLLGGDTVVYAHAHAARITSEPGDKSHRPSPDYRRWGPTSRSDNARYGRFVGWALATRAVSLVVGRIVIMVLLTTHTHSLPDGLTVDCPSLPLANISSSSSSSPASRGDPGRKRWRR